MTQKTVITPTRQSIRITNELAELTNWVKIAMQYTKPNLSIIGILLVLLLAQGVAGEDVYC